MNPTESNAVRIEKLEAEGESIAQEVEALIRGYIRITPAGPYSGYSIAGMREAFIGAVVARRRG